MNPVLGMPTLIELNGLKKCTDLCHELGLQFLELNMNMPDYQIGTFTVSEARTYGEEYGIYYTLHLDENLNVCDINPLVARAYEDTVKASIEFAHELKMPIINMHMANGIYFTLPRQRVYLFEKYQEKYMKKIMDFRALCERQIHNADIRICIENCEGFPEFARKAIEYLLESPVFALTLDIGHSHAAGGIDEPFFSQHIHKLAHMHIHDAKGLKNHLAVGDGEIAIEEKLELARQHHCRCVLETKTVEGLKSSVSQIRRLVKA